MQPHEFDECRFDVCVNDSVWYLRAESPEEKQRWISFLENQKVQSLNENWFYNQVSYVQSSNEPNLHLRRHGSAVSLTSNNFSTASGSSFRKSRGLREKISEIETYRDILIKQIDILQGFFDACVTAAATIKEQEVNTNSIHSYISDTLLVWFIIYFFYFFFRNR